ncbi:hypothetical protein [Nonomuraea salmonea]|uniref:hypothetical protein n=1 Tax=Nonomuraea salmonea TaxID=46181 RepID=UPI0031E6180C
MSVAVAAWGAVVVVGSAVAVAVTGSGLVGSVAVAAASVVAWGCSDAGGGGLG